MKINLKRILSSYERYGFINTFKKILKKFNIDLKILDPIQKKRGYLAKKIQVYSENTIISGAYKGTKLIESDHYFSAKSAQLLGCYEEEVQNEIKYLKEKFNINTLVNLGAGEGYHSVGCLNSKIVEYCINFEMMEDSRKYIKQNFQKNNLHNNYLILEKAEKNFLDLILDKIKLEETLFLLDVEGDEFKLLSEKVLSQLKNSFIIIEFHHFYSDNLSQEDLIRSIQKYFHIKWIKTESRNFSKYKVLNKFSDDEKWLMMSESRPATMQWLCCIPKK